MVRTRVREWSHPHMRSLNDRRTLTIVSVTSIAVVQEVLDFADMQILCAFTITVLFANGSHQPVTLARCFSDAWGYAIAASTIEIPSMRWRWGSTPTLLVVAIIILELLALALARNRRAIASLRDWVRVIRRNGSVEVYPDP